MKIQTTIAARGSTIGRVLVGLVLIACIAGAIRYWRNRDRSEFPAEIVSGNGTIEADQIDISTKYPGRIYEILVGEGDLIEPGQILARMDSTELETQLVKAKAQLATAREMVVESQAMITQRESVLLLTEQELARTLPLIKKGAISKQTGEQRTSARDSAKAALASAKAHLMTSKSNVDAAQAGVAQIQTQLDEYVLKSPVKGRVLYKLAETSEVLGAGGKVLTLLDLSEVYMEIFLPSTVASRLSIGAEARITIDATSNEFAIPAVVSFVSPKAQFTPKEVETLSERQKLMFRVKIRIPQELVIRHIEKVKTGVRGMGYVRVDDSVAWPKFLEKRYPEESQ